MMDDNKEVPNEESRAMPDQPSWMEEQTQTGEEAVQPETEPVPHDEVTLERTETPVEETTQDHEAAPQTQMPQTESSQQTGERESAPEAGGAVVEMLDAALAESQAQEPADGGQAMEVAEECVPSSSAVSPVDSEEAPTVESVIEAILFATDEPLPEGKLAGIVETTAKQVRESVENLNAKYQANGNAFRIEQIAGGYQMLTQPAYNSWLKKMVRVRSDNKLSPAAMETLAIIAYKQPIIRADIEAVRGVAVGEVIRSLMYKGLVKIAGRAEILGRPMLYGTTKKFLEIFGLNSLKDLPKAEDLKNPDRG